MRGSKGRNEHVTRQAKMAVFLLLGSALMAVPAGTAYAIEIGGPPTANALSRQLPDGQLQVLRNQIQRQQFQQQQQQYRAQDRQLAPPPVIEVPKVKPTCQVQVYGSNYLKTCR